MKKMIASTLILLSFLVSAVHATEKSMLLYVGPHSAYSCGKTALITNDQVEKKLSNVTDFIILPTGTYCNENYISYKYSSTEYYNYMEYINDVIDTLKVIEPSNKNVWISTPPTIFKDQAGNITNIYPRVWSDINSFLLDLRHQVINKVGLTFWDDKVNGIYLYDEYIDTNSSSLSYKYSRKLRDYIDVTYNGIPSADLNNPLASSWNSVQFQGPTYKGLHWNPYYGVRFSIDNHISVSNNQSRVLFDKIHIQPENVLYGSDLDSASAIKYADVGNWVSSQSIYGVSPITIHNKKTTIGVNMELDNVFAISSFPDETKNLSKKWYSLGVNWYQNMVGQHEFTFYIDASKAFNDTPQLLDCVNDFYDENLIEYIDVSNAYYARCFN